MVKLGDRVKDRISGFEGIVISTTQWITGCDTLQVEGQHHEGQKKILSVDTQQVEVLEAGAVCIGNAAVAPPVPPEPERASVAPQLRVKGGPHDILPDRGR